MRAPIDAPVAQAAAYSLEVVLPFADDPGLRWQDGVEWSPERCDAGSSGAVRCMAPVDPLLVGGENPSTVVADPFAIWHVESCSTFSRQRDLSGRARRGLQLSRSYLIAQALETGYDTEAEQDQRQLAHIDADTVTSGAEEPVAALACLDSAVVRGGLGRRGLIHVPPEVLTHLVAAQAVVRNGNRWDTAMGNTVISDAGYEGFGPNGEVPGATVWGYGTSMIRIRTGELTLTDPYPIDLGSGFINDLMVTATQLVMYEWDECVHYAAEFDVPECLTGGTS